MPSRPQPVVRVTAPAKINLRLAVGSVRDDGFHDLVTVFHAVDLADELVASVAHRMSLTVTGAADGVPTDAGNLALRAVELFAREAGVAPALRLRIHKRIPVAGGMAGGSADAAAALLACRALWLPSLPDERLAELAAELGSDVAFPLFGGTAVGTGRGERLKPVACAPLHWVVVPADGGISAGEAYRELDRQRGSDAVAHTDLGPLLDAMQRGVVAEVAALLGNDLQDAALALRPDLQVTLDGGLDAGALAGLVSGSGPTCVFLCASAASAREVAGRLGPRALVASGPLAPRVCVP